MHAQTRTRGWGRTRARGKARCIFFYGARRNVKRRFTGHAFHRMTGSWPLKVLSVSESPSRRCGRAGVLVSLWYPVVYTALCGSSPVAVLSGLTSHAARLSVEALTRDTLHFQDLCPARRLGLGPAPGRAEVARRRAVAIEVACLVSARTRGARAGGGAPCPHHSTRRLTTQRILSRLAPAAPLAPRTNRKPRMGLSLLAGARSIARSSSGAGTASSRGISRGGGRAAGLPLRGGVAASGSRGGSGRVSATWISGAGLKEAAIAVDAVLSV